MSSPPVTLSLSSLSFTRLGRSDPSQPLVSPFAVLSVNEQPLFKTHVVQQTEACEWNIHTQNIHPITRSPSLFAWACGAEAAALEWPAASVVENINNMNISVNIEDDNIETGNSDLGCVRISLLELLYLSSNSVDGSFAHSAALHDSKHTALGRLVIRGKANIQSLIEALDISKADELDILMQFHSSWPWKAAVAHAQTAATQPGQTATAASVSESAQQATMAAVCRSPFRYVFLHRPSFLRLLSGLRSLASAAHSPSVERLTNSLYGSIGIALEALQGEELKSLIDGLISNQGEILHLLNEFRPVQWPARPQTQGTQQGQAQDKEKEKEKGHGKVRESDREKSRQKFVLDHTKYIALWDQLSAALAKADPASAVAMPVAAAAPVDGAALTPSGRARLSASPILFQSWAHRAHVHVNGLATVRALMQYMAMRWLEKAGAKPKEREIVDESGYQALTEDLIYFLRVGNFAVTFDEAALKERDELLAAARERESKAASEAAGETLQIPGAATASVGEASAGLAALNVDQSSAVKAAETPSAAAASLEGAPLNRATVMKAMNSECAWLCKLASTVYSKATKITEDEDTLAALAKAVDAFQVNFITENPKASRRTVSAKKKAAH